MGKVNNYISYVLVLLAFSEKTRGGKRLSNYNDHLREWRESFYDFCTILKLFYVDDDRMGIGKVCDFSSHNQRRRRTVF